MIPQVQSKVGANGRCLNATLASILEIPESSVPDFGGDDEWLENTARFLEPFGLYYVEVNPTDPILKVMFASLTPIYHVITGISPRGGPHAIVGDRGTPIWDPHPNDGTGHGLVNVGKFGLLGSRMIANDQRARLHRALDKVLAKGNR